MHNIIKERVVLLASIALLLLLGFSFNLSQAQSEGEHLEGFELASADLSETELLSPLISMDFQDADLKDILKVFSQQADLNFIASENIKDRKITLYLDKVSVQDALTTIMTANNLTYEQEPESKIFVVKEWGRPEVETITMIFPLQYARVKGYELAVAGEEKGSSGGGLGINEVIEKLLTEHGQVVEDARTNSLIVTDLPSQFPKIEKAIKELDIKLPQVMIEAEVIETSLQTIDKLGISWGSSTEGNLFSVTGASRTDSFPFTKFTSSDAVTYTTGSISATNLTATLAMLKKDTDSRILARPKILTLNNQTAEINITADTAVSSGAVKIAAEGGVSTSSTSVERYETGVSLKVTPQINKAGEITMSIEPSVTNVKSSVLTGDYYDPQTRSAKTTVTVNDGATVIIGGLINVEETNISRKMPFFGDIPFLGNIFRKKDDTSTDKELIIFITPHLLDEGTKTGALALEKQMPYEYGNLRLKEEAMERILDGFEE